MGPQFILEDSGLPYEAIKVNLRDPAERAEYVKNVNSKGQVPAISIDGKVITEAPAIYTAISQLVPEKNYLGGAQDLVRFYEWISFLGTSVHSKFGLMFVPHKVTDDPAHFDAIKAKAKQGAIDSLALIEERLAASKTTFALGENLTGVDAYLAVIAMWAKFNGTWDDKAYPTYNALAEKISGLESFKKMVGQNAV